MRNRLLIVLLGFIGIVVVWCRSADVDNEGPPNILLVVLDDLGYNDLGANGNPNVPTPNLDALAAQGMLYTRHYAEASCSVARTALLTGTFPATHGLRPNHLGLSSDTPTIASILKQAGYLTQHIGKWHIATSTLEQSPSQLGFDNWFGFLHQYELGGPSADGISYAKPTYFNPQLRENQSPTKQYSGHLTDILTQRAIGFLNQQKEQSQPWFLNLWYYAPHNPMQPDARFRERHPATREGVYFALLDQLDYSVGEVMKTLESNGQADNTLVIVVSDNGGTNRETDNNAPFYGKKVQFFEGGLRTPLFMRWPGHIEAEAVSDELVSLYDIFPTIAQASGATPPPDLIGRSLLDEHRAPPPQLYWEYTDSTQHAFSILSADGHWRFTRGFYGPPTLNDLQSDPTGTENVYDAHPDVASELIEDYLHWRKTARVVDVSYEALNDRGGAILRGKDMQRSPGNAGFTFAIGVTPSPNPATGPNLIVDQAQRWQLRSEGEQGITLEILGQTISAPSLALGVCSELVITSYFRFSPRTPQKNWSVIDLYINRELVNSVRLEKPTPQNWGYANPTYVGFNADNGEPYSGELSRPVILNERIVADSLSGMIANGISEVASTCAPSEGGTPDGLNDSVTPDQ